MKFIHLCAAALGLAVMTSGAHAITYQFTAERAAGSALGGTPAPGTATAYAGSDEGATISGLFSFDADAPVVQSLGFPGTDILFYGGDASVTLLGSAGEVFSMDAANNFTPTGSQFGYNVLDLAPSAPAGADRFVIGVDNATDVVIMRFIAPDTSYFGPDQRPGLLSLSDFAQSELLVFVTGAGTAEAVQYNLTSVAPIPLPASALMLMTGLLGCAVIARRRAAA